MHISDHVRRWAQCLCSMVMVVPFLCSVSFVHEAGATGFTVLHAFSGGNDGQFPEAGLTLSGDEMFGTTFGSLGQPGKQCSKGCGNDYAIHETKLTDGYLFQGGADGAFPSGEVIVESHTVYGTTEFGGGTACNGLGCGTVFAVQGKTELQEFKFCPPEEFPICAYGAFPHAGPIMGIDGNLYGTTSLGGAGTGYACDNNFAGCGTVYKISTSLQTISVLYSFCRSQYPGCSDGAVPFGRLLQDPKTSSFFGTTQFGGAYGQGTIFELQPTKDGSFYRETVLHSFQGGADGAVPEAGLIEDRAGNLYGTASAGGGGNCAGSSPGCGAVFELSVSGTYTVLHAFSGGTSGDGALPQAPLTLDPAGNLYGNTEKGGDGPYCANPVVGCGTVFKLAADGKETILHTFGEARKHTDGAQPEGALLLYKNALYGATRVFGSPCDCGTLYKLDVGAPARTKRSRQARP